MAMSATATSTSNNILADRHIANKDYPRSPSSISPTSSRRDSLRHRHTEPPTPNSPPIRLTRKRAGSHDTDAAHHPRMDDPALSNGNIFEPKGGIRTDHVCLCQPDPKIPRPRNAFILYRQHYQAQVVAQHPGLANPEISKIIGEQWRDQPIEVKNDWKRLAEEEKQRHQRQYPDYRYQPRRAGKPAGTRPVTASGEETTRCPKCGGRYISTPSTPLTPFTPPFSATRTVLQPPFGSQQSPPRPSTGPVEVDRSRYQPAPMPALRTAPPYPQMHQRPQYSPQSASIPMRDRDRNEDMEMRSPSTPYKRRRFEPEEHTRQPSYPPPQGSYPPQQRPSQRPPPSISGSPYPEDRRRVFQVHGYHHSGSGMMDPPPRPSPPYSQSYPHHQSQAQSQSQMQQLPQPSPRNMAFDESLRLPPLQTQIPHQGQHTRLELGAAGVLGRMGIDHHLRNESHARSVQAMVMTIPYLNKIKVLAKISPPLAPPGPTSPVLDIRGAVIAVEGTDLSLVAEVGRFLEEHLSKDTECFVRTWTALAASASRKVSDRSASGDGREQQSPRDMEISGVSSNVAGLSLSDANSNDFLRYLNEIQTWHARSFEMSRFITTATSRTSTPVPTSTTVTGDGGEAISPKSIPPNMSSSLDSTKRNSTSMGNPPSPSPSTSTTGADRHPTATSASAGSTNSNRIPIALLPNGFSLSTSDAFASSIPINDAYAPVDHWQWMATLWRGIIGPDLTIYVKTVDINAPGSGGGGGPNGEGMSGREEMNRYGGVEIRHDCRAVIVRVEKGTGSGNNGTVGQVEEKTLRRLGFEVLEFVRSEGGKEGAGFGRG